MPLPSRKDGDAKPPCITVARSLPLPFPLDWSLTPEKLRLQLEIRSAGKFRLVRGSINESLEIVSSKQQTLVLDSSP